MIRWNFQLSAEFEGDENELYKFHHRHGTLESDYYPIKPDPLDARQQELLDGLYRSRREAEPDGRTSRMIIAQNVDNMLFNDTDIAIYAMQKLDDYYLELVAEKLRQDAKRAGE